MANAEAIYNGAKAFNKAEFSLATTAVGDTASLAPCYDYVSGTSATRKWGTDCTAANKATYKTSMCVATAGSACYDTLAAAMTTANI